MRALDPAGMGDLNLREVLIDQLRFAVSLGREDPEFLRLAGALPRERINHLSTAAD